MTPKQGPSKNYLSCICIERDGESTVYNIHIHIYTYTCIYIYIYLHIEIHFLPLVFTIYTVALGRIERVLTMDSMA